MRRKVQSHYLVLGQEGAGAGEHTPVTVSQTKIVKPQAARAAGEADRRFTCGVRIAG